MAPVSEALTRQFRRVLPPEKQSIAKSIIVEAAAETFEFLEEIVSEISYATFMDRLSIQEFEALRLLAFSDEFEHVDDTAKLQLTKGADLDEVRSHAAYAEIRGMLRETAKLLANPENARQWLERRGGKKARAALLRSMKATGDKILGRDRTGATVVMGVAPFREGPRSAEAVLNRELPAISREKSDQPMVSLDPETAALIDDTLDRMERFESSRVITQQVPAPAASGDPEPPG